MSELQSHDSSHSEAEEYGISSLVFRARRPFHPQRLYHFIETYLDPLTEDDEEDEEQQPEKVDVGRIVRSKGFFWLASRWSQSLVWAQAGGLFSLTSGGSWLFSALRSVDHDGLTEEELEGWREEVRDDWQDDQIGDRRQEIVFIGVHLKKDKLQQLLDECLIREEEMQSLLRQEADVKALLGGENPLGLEDPFPDEEEGDESGGRNEAEAEVEFEIIEPTLDRALV